MLPKHRRLKSPKLFKRALATTPFFRSSYFLAFVAPHSVDIAENKRQNTRFGIIISKKVDKRACVRNTIKRRLREAIRQFVLSQYAGQLNDYAAIIVLVRQQAVNATFYQLSDQLDKAFGGLVSNHQAQSSLSPITENEG